MTAAVCYRLLVGVDEILERAGTVLRRGPPLRVAALFGSRATGLARPDSDVDIAIVPHDPSLSLWDEGGLAADLEMALGLPVDLVRMDLAPTLVRWEIVKSGRPILADPPDAWTRLVASVLGEHADHRPAADRLARAFLQKLAQGDRFPHSLK